MVNKDYHNAGCWHTTELLRMLLHVRENKRIGIGDEKSVSEDMDDRADVEVLRTVELRLFRRTSRLGDACPFQKLAANHAGVLEWRLVNGDHVVRQSIRNDKSPTFVQRIRRVLQHQ